MKRMIVAGVFSLSCLGASTAGADLGPRPIRDTGVWNDPSRLRLARNRVEVVLGEKAADVKACFVFVSETPVAQWDKGSLAWTWPLPSGFPRPEQFGVASTTFGARTYEEGASEPREGVCTITNNRREITGLKPVSFERLGIVQWYRFEDAFFLHAPSSLLVVRMVVTYRQPYRQTPQGLTEMVYVLRTGSLWAKTVGLLELQVRSEPGVALVDSSMKLHGGKAEMTDVEPQTDLLLRLRPTATGLRK